LAILDNFHEAYGAALTEAWKKMGFELGGIFLDNSIITFRITIFSMIIKKMQQLA
jgi:hypothetical protein